MEIKRSGSQPSGKGPAEYFTGTVRVDPRNCTFRPLRADDGQSATNASRLVLINALAVIDADSVVIGHPAVIVEPLAPKKALLKRRPTESQVTIRKAFGL
jgi:hypothetical protein